MFFWFYWHWQKKQEGRHWSLTLFVFHCHVVIFLLFSFCPDKSNFVKWSKRDQYFFWRRLSAHYQPLWSKTLLTMALSFIFQVDSFVLCSWYLVLFALQMNEQIPPVETKWIKQLLIWSTGQPSKHRRRQWAVILVKTRETSLQVRLFLPCIFPTAVTFSRRLRKHFRNFTCMFVLDLICVISAKNNYGVPASNLIY